MHPFAKSLAILLSFAAAQTTFAQNQNWRQITSLDEGWTFTTGDPTGAEKPDFNDSTWRKLNLPHDWSIEGPINPANPSGTAQAFLPMGVGWYRKKIPAELLIANTFIQFDGITSNGSVYFDGRKLGERVGGYSSVTYALKRPGYSLPEGDHVIAVRVDNSLQPSSRWYAGSGITRHVRLLNPSWEYILPQRSFIHTVKADERQAVIRIEAKSVVTDMPNRGGLPFSRDLHLYVEIRDPKGIVVSNTELTNYTQDQTATFADVMLNRPILWNADGKESQLYVANIQLKSRGTLVDEQTIPFGIRTAEFKPDTGFHLNGKNIKLQGVCLHLDGGGIGAAVPMSVWERRLDLLRSLGVNAIRTSHNAPDPAFLDLCDRKGFLVMHEIFDTWTAPKVRGDYARFFKDNWRQDLTDAILRDRNHPSIIIYSAGNEIRDSTAQQLELFPQLRDLYHQLDPTRPVTLAMFRPNTAGGGFTSGLAQMQDVVGANYRPAELVAFARANPGTKIIETETNYTPAAFPALRDNPELAGQFLWTGVDYLGEGMGGISQGFGLIDRTNQPKARAFEHAQWWSPDPMVKIARVAGTGRDGNRDLGGGRVLDWTPANQQPHNETVEVYSNADEVELFLNNTSLGTKPKPNTLTCTWQVPYAPGTLKAIARNARADVAQDLLTSAGPVTKLSLTTDQKTLTTNWDDVCYVRVTLTDTAGTTNPTATAKITFDLTGPATLMAVDNADLDSTEPFRGTTRTTYQGTAIAIIKATGNGPITVRARTEGLAPSEVTLTGKTGS